MLKVEDWSQLYYAVIKKELISNEVTVLGVGSTLSSAKQKAISYSSQLKRSHPTAIQAYSDAINNCDLNSYIIPYSVNGKFKIGIVYAEAKVKIYGERYGLEGMKVVFDPTYKDDLLTFAGYDKILKARLEDARTKFEF